MPAHTIFPRNVLRSTILVFTRYAIYMAMAGFISSDGCSCINGILSQRLAPFDSTPTPGISTNTNSNTHIQNPLGISGIYLSGSIVEITIIPTKPATTNISCRLKK